MIATPRVLLRYHARMAPPDGGPFDLGTFAAWLAGRPLPRGYGGTERAAIAELAKQLCELSRPPSASLRLTAFGQVLAAAQRLSAADFVSYLEQRAEVPVLD